MNKNYYLGIDIGATITKFCITDNKLNVLYNKFFKTNKVNNIEELITKIKYYLNEEFQIELKEILGIGICAPNGNFYTGNIEHAINLSWESKKINISEIFKQHFNVKIVVNNDANAFALAEKYFGIGKNFKNFVLLTIGTGLGCGIIINNKLLLGSYGNAGEFGHTILYNNSNRLCSCGKYGCAEEYISERGIIKTYLEISNSNNKNLTAYEIYHLAKNCNENALKSFKKMGQDLGKALSNLILIIEPETIILTGGVANAHEFFLNETINIMEKNLLPAFKNKCKVLISNLINYNYIGALGSLIPLRYDI